MRNEQTKRWLAALMLTACMGLGLPAGAQDPVELDEIVIGGALTALGPQPVSRVGATVEALDADALAASPSTSLAGTLTRLPGVTLSSDGGLGANTTLRIRGLDTSYIGTRIDGIDVTDPSSTQTSFDFGGLTATNIGQVDLIKGSQSALFGSEAIAGVVDITTAQSDEIGFSNRARIEAGSFDTFAGSFGLTQRGERGQISFNIDRTISDGISARAGDDEKDGFNQTFASLTGDFAATDAVTLGFSALWRDAEVEIDRSETDNSGVNYTEQRGARVFARVDALGAAHELSYSVFSSDREDPGGFTREFGGDRRQLAYVASADVGTTTLSFGLDRTVEEIRTDTVSAEDTTVSILGEAVLRPTSSIELAVSVRHDDSDDFGGETTGRLALAWLASADTMIRASVGTGFRAPSLFERFASFGNPDLRPEESLSFDLGVEHRFGTTGFVKATLFQVEIDDLIDFDGASTVCASGFGCYAQIPGTTRTRGIELSGRVDVIPGRAAAFGAYTYTEAETEGDRRARVPRHDLLIGVEGDFAPRLSGRVEVRHVADVEPSVFAPADNKVGDYTLVGLGLGYDVRDGVAATLRVENLFDEDYETAGGFQQPGRAVFAGISASF
ncbi:TonB-dependent receptor plug domain-containing protein [Jannaschia aquimarina]|uniref:BtuB protein n=1 Tax=Jannaschia aquimarina TaxID=935700 RepID=A0A0D1EIU7_9RHOB|nr:TonB-dependent receptor [Jannaschia aquimarina]KIT17559.1 Vitamin B12 transporter BtuB precursor [Jannaschia aquimarina]SNS72875.1 vitamin B12 transporter [Jannaschia aquimarina]